MFKAVNFIVLGMLIAVACLYLDTARFQSLEATQAVSELQNRMETFERSNGLQDVRFVTVTAYAPRVEETNSDPTTTASMQRPRPGMVAVSRDLFHAGWVFGKKVYIEGVGIFEIQDLMNKRWTERLDVLLFDVEAARRFGMKEDVAAVLLGN